MGWTEVWQYSKLVKCPLENQYFASYIAMQRFILNAFVLKTFNTIFYFEIFEIDSIRSGWGQVFEN